MSQRRNEFLRNHPKADAYTWATRFRELFSRCVARYRAGKRAYDEWFGAEDLEFLEGIGCGRRELYDFVEDHCAEDGREPSAETALLIAAVRRDYFLAEQGGSPSGRIVSQSELPAKAAALGGIPWLPRIIAKAEVKLRGELDGDTMFGCGGDRAFCREHGLHPADFLRVVWAARGDAKRVLEYVRAGKPA